MPNSLHRYSIDINQFPQERYTLTHSITWGDMHGNALMLLHLLVKFNVIRMTKEDYNAFKQLYYSWWSLSRSQLLALDALITRIDVQDPKVTIRLIGDELCDRGRNDYLTIKLLMLLFKNKIDLRILASNHAMGFLNGEKKLAINVWPCPSYIKFQALKKKFPDIIPRETTRFLEAYKNHLYLIDTEETNGEPGYFTHAPSRQTMRDAAILSLDCSADLEAINTAFRDRLNDRAFLEELQGDAHPVTQLFWNRDTTDADSIHGHIGPRESSGTNLDSNTGKSPKTHRGQINIFSQGEPKLDVDPSLQLAFEKKHQPYLQTLQKLTHETTTNAGRLLSVFAGVGTGLGLAFAPSSLGALTTGLLSVGLSTPASPIIAAAIIGFAVLIGINLITLGITTQQKKALLSSEHAESGIDSFSHLKQIASIFLPPLRIIRWLVIDLLSNTKIMAWAYEITLRPHFNLFKNLLKMLRDVYQELYIEIYYHPRAFLMHLIKVPFIVSFLIMHSINLYIGELNKAIATWGKYPLPFDPSFRVGHKPSFIWHQIRYNFTDIACTFLEMLPQTLFYLPINFICSLRHFIPWVGMSSFPYDAKTIASELTQLRHQESSQTLQQATEAKMIGKIILFFIPALELKNNQRYLNYIASALSLPFRLLKWVTLDTLMRSNSFVMIYNIALRPVVIFVAMIAKDISKVLLGKSPMITKLLRAPLILTLILLNHLSNMLQSILSDTSTWGNIIQVKNRHNRLLEKLPKELMNTQYDFISTLTDIFVFFDILVKICRLSFTLINQLLELVMITPFNLIGMCHNLIPLIKNNYEKAPLQLVFWFYAPAKLIAKICLFEHFIDDIVAKQTGAKKTCLLLLSPLIGPLYTLFNIFRPLQSEANDYAPLQQSGSDNRFYVPYHTPRSDLKWFIQQTNSKQSHMACDDQTKHTKNDSLFKGVIHRFAPCLTIHPKEPIN